MRDGCLRERLELLGRAFAGHFEEHGYAQNHNDDNADRDADFLSCR